MISITTELFSSKLTPYFLQHKVLFLTICQMFLRNANNSFSHLDIIFAFLLFFSRSSKARTQLLQKAFLLFIVFLTLHICPNIMIINITLIKLKLILIVFYNCFKTHLLSFLLNLLHLIYCILIHFIPNIIVFVLFFFWLLEPFFILIIFRGYQSYSWFFVCVLIRDYLFYHFRPLLFFRRLLSYFLKIYIV